MRVYSTSPTIRFKIGESMVITSSYGALCYSKNGGSFEQYNFNTDQFNQPAGDFMWLGGHNYGGGLICLNKGDYIFKNVGLASYENYSVPNRIV